MFQPLYVRPLNDEEKESLLTSVQAANREEAVRASVILLSSEGRTATEISQQLGVHPTNVKKWIRRFNEPGLAALAAKTRGPQGGPRPRFPPSQIEEIIRLAARPPASLGYG